MPELILIRGIPGSGKSTLAARQYPNHYLVEADMFFETGSGYIYNPDMVSKAHEWCQKTVRKLLDDGYNVVVANTFTRVWEMQPYMDMGYFFQVVEATGNFQNTHGVPDDAVKRMKERYEPF